MGFVLRKPIKLDDLSGGGALFEQRGQRSAPLVREVAGRRCTPQL